MSWQNYRLVFTAAFALFAMFFGSGNLLYPIDVGVNTGSGFLWALPGFLLTGVFVPFLGLLATMASSKKKEDFFAPLGRPTNLTLSLLTLSLMGPFGVGARCILVARSGLSLHMPNVPVELIGFAFLSLCAVLLLKKESLVQIIGRYLTPFLLIGLVVLIFASLKSFTFPKELCSSPFENFKKGGNIGYQMMDLLAAIFFGHSIYSYLQKSLGKKSQKENFKLSLLAGILGASMLGVLYTGLVTVGANYASELALIDPEKRLVTIAHMALGPFALSISTLVIALACLTTLCVLMELFADFMRLELFPKKLNRKISILITLGITFLVSLAGFFTLASWIAMTLALIYPALIIFSILRLLEINRKISRKTLQILSGLATGICLLVLFIK